MFLVGRSDEVIIRDLGFLCQFLQVVSWRDSSGGDRAYFEDGGALVAEELRFDAGLFRRFLDLQTDEHLH